MNFDVQGLYKRMRATDLDVLRDGGDTGRGTQYRIFTRGCGGGSSFLVREEKMPENDCQAWVVFALGVDGGIESSSFATPQDAQDFVRAAVGAICR